MGGFTLIGLLAHNHREIYFLFTLSKKQYGCIYNFSLALNLNVILLVYTLWCTRNFEYEMEIHLSLCYIPLQHAILHYAIMISGGLDISLLLSTHTLASLLLTTLTVKKWRVFTLRFEEPHIHLKIPLTLRVYKFGQSRYWLRWRTWILNKL